MKRITLSLALMGGLAVAAAAQQPVTGSSAADLGARTSGVSPGAEEAFALAVACPTFSWAAAVGAQAYELAVYRIDDGLAAIQPALEARIPGAALAWTPAADRCLTAGERYGWSVRAVTDRVRGEWSEALLFEVAVAPADLAAALEVLRRHLGSDGLVAALEANASPATSPSAEVPAGLPPTQNSSGPAEQGAGAPLIAVRGEVPDVAGETYGVRGVANSPDGAGVRADNNNASGPDLLLGGSPVAELTEVTFSRDSASNLTFNFTNPGAGTMTVQADGSNLVTAGGGSALWVDQSGDTMTGSLSLGGNALTGLGDVALNSASTVTKGGTRFIWDDAVSKSFGAGRFSLASNTGANNTAVGAEALEANLGGFENTASGTQALGANTTGSRNTATGAFALNANTTGGANTAVGRVALGANTTGGNNTAVGAYALDANTTGTYNVALGFDALGANTTALKNTAVGANALEANTTGANNVALGSNALAANTTASRNTAVGARALDANTTGFFNVALGYSALGANTTAVENTAVGVYALDANTTGSFNVALGMHALGTNTTGFSNAAVGRFALFANMTGSSNVAVGSFALANTTASNNTAVGTYALISTTTGSRNVAVGFNALVSTTTANDNTALGTYALDSNTTGFSNVAVGINALGANTTGFSNIALGPSAGVALTTGSNNITIGNVGAAAETGKIRVGIQGTQTETFIAGIHGNTTSGGIAVFVNSSGELGTTTSSRRFKEDIQDIGEASSALLELRPVSFRYRREVVGEERPLEFGLIAEEVAEVLPELVAYGEDGEPYTVRYHLLVPLLLSEVQRLRAEMEVLRAALAPRQRPAWGAQ